MFKYLGSSTAMDKRVFENYNRKTNEEEDFRLLVSNSAIFSKIIESIPPNSPNFLELLNREANKRLQVHSLKCKKCKMKENGSRANCQTVLILINIEEGL